jgi:chromosome segregation ATPase
MQKASDHEITVKGRKEELAALGKAKKILQQMAAKLVQVGNAPSFLQTKVSSTMRTSADLANAEIVNLLKKVARQHHSAALSQLSSKIATLIRYSSKTGDDPFAKIKTLIEEMIAKLMKEAAAEASEKAYCDEQMARTEAKKAELEDDTAKLTSKIDKAAAKSAGLKADVKELQGELAALAKMQAEMDSMRMEERTNYAQAKSDLSGIAGCCMIELMPDPAWTMEAPVEP